MQERAASSDHPETWPPPYLRVEDFVEAADHLSKGCLAPIWLPTFLFHWAPDLVLQRRAEGRRLKKAEMKRILQSVEKAAIEIHRAIQDPSVMAFLDRARPFPFQNSLGTKIFVADIATRAHFASQFETISNESGKAGKGPRKATAPGDYDAKDLCAAIVAEVWHYLHGKSPSRTNRAAAKAASAFWRASGGDLKGWSAAQVGLWPPYFDRVNSPALEGKRKEIRRQLSIYATNPA